MQSDWSVACGPDDPTVAVPWAGAEATLRYIDLREAPDRIEEIPEAVLYPCIHAALRCWNSPDSPYFTAKCDVWSYPAELYDAEDLSEFGYAQASYVDLLSRDESTFSQFSIAETLLKALSGLADLVPATAARCEWILRPAYLFSGTESVSGFAMTLYIWGYGDSPEAAAGTWAAAVAALVEPLLPRRRCP